MERKKEAEQMKAEGNQAYQAKNFDKALKFYGIAIRLDPTDALYYTNKAAVYMEMGDFESCITECDNAFKVLKSGYYDCAKFSRTLTRKASAYLKIGNLAKSVELFEAAYFENNDPTIKE